MHTQGAGMLGKIVVCPTCGKVGSTDDKRTFTGFLKCSCSTCNSEFLYPLSGLFLFIYSFLSIKQVAIIVFSVMEVVEGNQDIGFLIFILPLPLLILAGSLVMLLRNFKINALIAKTKNA
ncbi:MAG: hypothetical protein JKY26_01105 [Pseudomonas sp.]|nr:hypothetical protein [Pseudomonas sp.]